MDVISSAASTTPIIAAGSVHARVPGEFKELYSRFLIRNPSYALQYCHIYQKRLALLRPLVLETARVRWPAVNGRPAPRVCQKVIDLRPDETADTVLVGCTFKEMPLKPSVLDSYSGDRAMSAIKLRPNNTSAGDRLVCEDESGRVALIAGNRSGAPFPLSRLTATFVTGVVVAFRGYTLASGEFAVNDFCVVGLPRESRSLPRSLPPPGTPKRILVLVSNLFVGAPGTHAASLQIFSEWLSGMAGGMQAAAGAARVCRLVIAGGLMAPRRERVVDEVGKGSSAASASANTGMSAGTIGVGSFTDSRLATAAEQEESTASLRDADAFLSLLTATVDVDVMPGPHDAANRTLPQKPLHPVLFPLSARFSTLHFITNPVDASICGTRILGTSGQNVVDIIRYSSASENVADLELSIASEAVAHVADALTDSAAASAVATEAAAILASESAMGDGDEGGTAAPPSALAHATGGTSADVAMNLIANTGASSGAPGGSGGDAASDAIRDDEGAAIAARLNPLNVLANTLLWRHMAPTAPDTLPCYPFAETDPFVIRDEEIPGIYFSGGTQGFATRSIESGPNGARVRIICVPDFSKTATAVVVDLDGEDYNAQPIFFRTSVGGAEN